ncbi:MAG: hypothetical protein RMX60_08655 [Planktomarina sp.]|nr:hypothetical protein [Planktomarina sp.]
MADCVGCGIRIGRFTVVPGGTCDVCARELGTATLDQMKNH